MQYADKACKIKPAHRIKRYAGRKKPENIDYSR
jgi:hypothetical protein